MGEASEDDIRRYEQAIVSYKKTGHSDVRCDRCGEFISVQIDENSTGLTRCACGKFNGTLRGL